MLDSLLVGLQAGTCKLSIDSLSYRLIERTAMSVPPTPASPSSSTPPVPALVVVGAAWFFFFVIIAFYSMATLLLLPLVPLFLFGPVCLLCEAHQYAARAAERRGSR
jgi:hypothetical protein